MALTGQRLELGVNIGKKKSFIALFARLCFDGHDGEKTAPSGRNFKLVTRRLARSAERIGLVRANNNTVLTDKSISDNFSLDESIESSQVTTVLTFQVEEYLGVGGRWL